MTVDTKTLIRRAIKAMERAYVPYSGFKVGAALLTESGELYEGCNIENAAYTPSNCAERTAVFKAVSEGKRDFICIVIMGGKNGRAEDYCPPCGICRQVLREFVHPKEFQVILAKPTGEYRVLFLEELLPESFGPEYL